MFPTGLYREDSRHAADRLNCPLHKLSALFGRVSWACVPKLRVSIVVDSSTPQDKLLNWPSERTVNFTPRNRGELVALIAFRRTCPQLY